MSHPFAVKNDSFQIGDVVIKSGEKALLNGKEVMVDEVLPDGEAFFSSDDGYGVAKWRMFQPLGATP